MKQYAVIVAGGSGTRLGSEIPKQFLSLNGRPVLWWSMKAFHDENPDTRLILVLPQEYLSLWNNMFASLPAEEQYPHEIATGGTTRVQSVKNGLSLIEDENSYVAIHDGARPLVTPELIHRGWETVKINGACIPGVAVTDSLRYKENDHTTASVDRACYVAVQTPQVFESAMIKEAYEAAGDKSFTDDAAVAENSGKHITLFEGSYDNIKITNPRDMAIAAVIMARDA